MMEVLIFLYTLSTIILLIVLMLETHQYRRILKAADTVDDYDSQYRKLIKDLGNIVNNNAEILGSFGSDLAEFSTEIESLKLTTKTHTVLIDVLIQGMRLKNFGEEN